MSVASIVIQIVLGLMFLMSGAMKFSPKMAEEFKRYRYPGWFRGFTGLVEIVGAALLIAGIWIDPLAAWGGLILAVTMAGAVITHIRLKDPASRSGAPVVLFLLSLAVLVMNWSALF